jgi:hypothetical protein
MLVSIEQPVRNGVAPIYSEQRQYLTAQRKACCVKQTRVTVCLNSSLTIAQYRSDQSCLDAVLCAPLEYSCVVSCIVQSVA